MVISSISYLYIMKIYQWITSFVPKKLYFAISYVSNFLEILKKNLHATSSTFWQRIINLLGYNQSQTGLVTEWFFEFTLKFNLVQWSMQRTPSFNSCKFIVKMLVATFAVRLFIFFILISQKKNVRFILHSKWHNKDSFGAKIPHFYLHVTRITVYHQFWFK